MSFKAPSTLQYLSSHEWILITGDTATIGITDYAQDSLGDVVYVDLPAIGTVLAAGAEFGVVESVKASSELYSPAGGTVIDVNAAVSDRTELVNTDPYDKGWLIKMKLDGTTGSLLDATAYTALVDSIKH
jgi:glycine cleavage system H protein